jgi:hypothetical protein
LPCKGFDLIAPPALAVHVFPVALLALRHPFHCLRQPFRSSFVARGFGDPFDVFAFVTGREFFCLDVALG